ncbi:MAG: Ig-like domain-containing protein, partial [Candidatus Limnocylindria bacterium]
SGLDWSIDPDNEDCEITGPVGAQVLECNFGDLGPDEGASVHVVSETAQADCATYLNVADITSTNHEELNPSDSVTVECPGLNIDKVAIKSPIDAGETASYSIVVWNTGPGTAVNVTLEDDLPGDLSWSENSEDCSIKAGVLTCSFGDLGVTTPENSPAKVTVSAVTDRSDCGILDNDAFADADNNDRVGPAEASITVKCPTISIVKVNNQPNPVLPGTVVSYTVTVTVSNGPANGVVVTDVLPLGLDAPTSISNAGSYAPATRTITWNLGQLANGSHALTYQAAVSAGTAHGASLVNLAVVTSPNSQCPDVRSIAPECDDDSTVLVRVPTLVIDKAANAEVVHFVFNANGSVQSVTPAQVTWTLTYTLANGPVSNAVISDPLPAFLNFVSASNGGTFAAGTITWNLGTLTTSGSVSFVTTVASNAPETGPIVNVATIDSTETAPDTGQDSIRITSEQVQAGTGTPAPSVPDSAISFAPAGQPISIPVELMAVLFLLSLGGLAFANVKAARRRR